MANQQARHDDNRVTGLIGHSSVSDPSETRRVVVDDTGRLTTNSESQAYDTLIEEASATVTYIGNCEVGSAAETSAAIWRIKKVDTATDTKITYADGVSTFTKVWDNRGTYSY